MPGPYVVPVHGDADLPAEVDIVVIGGGIIGTSTALELAERGLRVALCEKGGIGHEQSSRNWGWVRISRRDPREVPLMAEALRLWSNLDQRIGRATGYKRAGILFTCASDQEFADHERWNRNLEGYQLDSRMLSAGEFRAMFPNADMDIKGALYTSADGRAEPQVAAPAVAEAARDKGATILTECAVRGIETSGGRISGVVTERGPIACSAVVLAGGAWSSLFSGNFGIDLPQLKVMNSVLRTKPLEGGPEQAIWSQGFAVRKRQDGGYTIASGHENVVDIVPKSFRYARDFMPAFGKEWRSLKFRVGGRFLDEARIPNRWSMDEASPFEYNRVLDPKPANKLSDLALANLKKAFPVFEKAEIAQRWAGYIDVTPDAVPVISAVDQIPGFHIATGFSGHGFGIGPAAGKLMADIVTSRTPVVDPTAFRLSRFSDGSKIELISGF
ncbi:FAD-binding oxidoreductase [Rhizobium sp. VS19-DR104.2]|uniref:NAD(P)/FAD-dependent oxidoreductase n=1 Tax=unclassified Rhizobium TaxID=2613769 RepID=UPI001C5B3EFB|nr:MULTISPECIES: FAD-binding oxidoreductase [unclassified Rhizobium]MBZ5762738.1 FAD-binding oxidoreductase [Rhizobium sp. VS19-DR96]MBZ5768693.1 FAD-binding oxidoreductase [Rhizobium sp. VS19-DR129.2]MBZ5776190.1 FAD-binding oxidoreductase [Rhizobium sp. VS19-DRK62.2]MBZ5787064.1 FAD-binding oxidoreductase [Rhizobium sp. VS19-DR121]MBZ5804753.1 FAD-binding oxidoreductase [Rhizobium sp. VS19-DR181]